MHVNRYASALPLHSRARQPAPRGNKFLPVTAPRWRNR
ncbi:hypothetical protein BN2497_9429 [Janthinobacterium sp. CG23_2]|nr:hypothetical protein BN2497_9429 [Janthinobacterium sp. CG23_2]CUU31112.1 hypothetical protein BN3177_9429 [Janthinobacterium sp. CG23_2]